MNTRQDCVEATQSRQPRTPAVAELMSVREVARELGISPHTVRSWMAQRRLGYFRLGRAIRIDRSEIRRMLDQGHVAPYGALGARQVQTGMEVTRGNDPHGKTSSSSPRRDPRGANGPAQPIGDLPIA